MLFSVRWIMTARKMEAAAAKESGGVGKVKRGEGRGVPGMQENLSTSFHPANSCQDIEGK